ncbi:hypothetical protein ABF236_003567, partial [Yersinia ruckeri]
MTHVINEAVILSSESTARSLVADIQYLEPYTSSGLNRKLKGILKSGVYAGFKAVKGAGLSILVTSSGEKEGQGTASIDVGKHQITIQQLLDVSVSVPAGKKTIIALEANYAFGKETDQVDSSSTLKAAQIIAVSFEKGLSGNQIELCRIAVPENATTVTDEMIDLSHRLSQTVGITLSNKIDSDKEDIAANSKAVNDLRKSILSDVPDNLNTLGLIAQAIGADPKFSQNIVKELKGRMSQAANGSDIENVQQFL